MTKETPTFVFKGTIKKRTAAATGNKATGRTETANRAVVVSVDEVLEGSGHLADLVGQTVEVQVGVPARVSIGDALVFYTVPVSFGDTVVVRSLKQQPIGRAQGRAVRKSAPRAGTSSRDLEERLADADLVVSGRVETVKDAVDQSGPVTEHAPLWREAIVKVADVHKGRAGKRSIKVRFPASTDVRWYDAPKFEPGQEGVFLLHAGRGGKRPGVYTAPHPADFQPSNRENEVQSLVSGRSESES